MGETGCKPAAVKMLLYGSYRKVLDNQMHFVAKERKTKRRIKMKKIQRERRMVVRTGFCLTILGLLLTGCEGLRFVPNQRQKQNAWLHNRTAMIATQTAKQEDTSPELQSLTELSELQSRAFTSYFGLPKEFPSAESADDILGQSNLQLAKGAFEDSAARPDTWEVVDAGMELGIGICALLGGVYGTRAVRFLKQAKAKSKALKEIIAGNELFKKNNQTNSDAFKQAHQNQSPQTRQLVTEMKG